MKEFDAALLRLKGILGMTEDQDVARALGMSKAGFAQRKARDSFPADRLATLAMEKPELRIDVRWVVTGKTAQQRAVDAAASVAGGAAEAVRYLKHDAPPPPQANEGQRISPMPGITTAERAHLVALRQCDADDRAAIVQLVAKLAGPDRR